MGHLPFRLLDTNFKNLQSNDNNIVLEIGSENGEGSSFYLNTWAKNHNIDFYSIDVVDDAMKKYPDSGIKFIVANSGHEWCRDVLPTLNKKIKILYLDNFDWIYNEDDIDDDVKDQISSYLKRVVIMNNENSCEEHRLQSYYCIPYMDVDSVVFFDDTFSHGNNKYYGKSATAISLFVEAGFIIESNEDGALFGYKIKRLI